MDFEGKIISRDVSQLLWEMEKTVGTAESCTGGRIAETIMGVPGASKYFKGGIICYVNEVKENLLGVSHELMEEKTAVCEEVAVEMVKGACQTLNVDYAVAATGLAGPGGGSKEIPVGTIWLAVGNAERTITTKILEDHGRDINIAIATNTAMQMLRDFLIEENKEVEAADC